MQKSEFGREIARQQEENEITSAQVFDPDNPPWNVRSAAAVWLLSVLLILFLPMIALFPYLAARGVRGNQAEIQNFVLSDPTAVLIQIFSVIPAHLITFAAAWLVVTRGRKYDFFQAIGWKSGGMRWWHYPLILGAFFTVAAIIGSYIPERETDLIRILKSSKTAVYAVALLSVATAPIVEEVVYRGLLYSAIQRSAGKAFAVTIVTILFTIVHIPQYYQSISTIALLALLSLVLTVVRAATKNLLPCFILHLIFNAVQSVSLLVNPEFNSPSSVSFFLLR